MFETMRKSKGFTLIELLVVIAIIAILAAVAAPMVLKQIEKSRISNTITNYKAVKTGVEQYYADTFKFPTTLKLGGTATTSGLIINGASVAGWNGPYIEKDITNDTNKFGGAWIYTTGTAAAVLKSVALPNLAGGCSLAGGTTTTTSAYLQADGLTDPILLKLEEAVDGNTALDTAGSFCSVSGAPEGNFWLGDNR